LKNTRDINTKGIGLGLVISQMITQEFGGEIRVKSKYKVGSRFQSSFLLENEDQVMNHGELTHEKYLNMDLDNAHKNTMPRIVEDSMLAMRTLGPSQPALLRKDSRH
jgi:hypothetical protein